jgi:glycosyltransferase involved in cell wall biosynthesis
MIVREPSHNGRSHGPNGVLPAAVTGRVQAQAARPGADGLDLVVLVNGFPRLSETFVLQELLDLESRGLRLLLVALSDPGEAVRQGDLERLRAEVVHLPPAVSIPRRRAIRAHATLVERRRGGYLAALRALRRSPDFTPGVLARSTVLASRLVRLGSPPMYIHFAHKPATIGRFAARLAGVPYGLSCHAKDIWLTPPPELAVKVRDAEVVLTCTEAGREQLTLAAAGATPVLHVHHGVDVEVADERIAPSGAPSILTVGRFVEKKGHDTLIRAAAVLRDRGVECSLRIAGEGVEWPRLQRLVHALDLARHVTFLGPLTPAEVHAEYRAAHVFALACRTLPSGDRDGLPNVLLEAMVRRLPIVSTLQEGVCEAIEDGHSGLLVPADDAHALATALERVLLEPGLAGRLAAGARAAVAERFDRRALLPLVAEALAGAGLIRLGVSPARAVTAAGDAVRASANGDAVQAPSAPGDSAREAA